MLGGSVVASAQLSLADPVASHVGFNFMFFLLSISYFIVTVSIQHLLLSTE